MAKMQIHWKLAGSPSQNGAAMVEWSGVKAPAAGCWQLLLSDTALFSHYLLPCHPIVKFAHPMRGHSLPMLPFHAFTLPLPCRLPDLLTYFPCSSSLPSLFTCIVGHESLMNHQNVGMEGGHGQVPWFVKNQFLHWNFWPKFKILTFVRMCSVSHTWIISGYVGHHPTTFLLLLLGWYHTQWKLSNCHRICGPLNFHPP